MYSHSLLSVLGVSRDGDDVGWMQLLIFVAVGAIYAINAVLKARANKTREPEEEQYTPAGKRHPLIRPGRGQKQPGQQIRRPARQGPRVYRPQARPARPRVVRPELTTRPSAELERLQVEAERRQPAVSVEKPKRFVTETGREEPKEEIRIAPEGTEAGYVFEVPSASEDPEELKRAILYYEILGKPVSLREPSQ